MSNEKLLKILTWEIHDQRHIWEYEPRQFEKEELPEERQRQFWKILNHSRKREDDLECQYQRQSTDRWGKLRETT
jgi:hypothetical protein